GSTTLCLFKRNSNIPGLGRKSGKRFTTSAVLAILFSLSLFFSFLIFSSFILWYCSGNAMALPWDNLSSSACSGRSLCSISLPHRLLALSLCCFLFRSISLILSLRELEQNFSCSTRNNPYPFITCSMKLSSAWIAYAIRLGLYSAS